MQKEMSEKEYKVLLQELSYHARVVKYLTKAIKESSWTYPIHFDLHDDDQHKIYMMGDTVFRKLKYPAGTEESVTDYGKEKRFTIGNTIYVTVEE